ncbi:MAG: PEP/pyruvate-binding domain-containing protein [Candidatus Eisenbacteria bacterium]|nr:PEP/pyruvate-binding domain-containing protein [Candidatus Eisenbacteria bacterium]
MAAEASHLPEFGREFLGADQTFTRIGRGDYGGKAAGLDLVREKVLARISPDEFPDIEVVVPTLTVLTTELFDSFMKRNGIDPNSFANDSDDRIALAFQKAELPAEFVGDLRSLIASVHTPLAVRSSSLLEDALSHPFAGVYETKMIPNNQAGTDRRFQGLVQAVKFVYASTFFASARSYIKSVGEDIASEKMAVIIQEVVGTRSDERFYPTISGVARSYNYYPTGKAEPADGVVNLALGLGRQIVDGGLSWTYCPSYPTAPPPYAGVGDLMKNSQTEFWAVNMGHPPPPDPTRETEYLSKADLKAAEYDGRLDKLVSTYDGRSDRMRPGIQGEGPRVLDFAPILSYDALPLNDLIRRLLDLTKEALDEDVEIEFAVEVDPLGRSKPRFGFLQARPMMVSRDETTVTEEEMSDPRAVIASSHVLGNGTREDIADIVYLRPEAFEAKHTPAIAAELEKVNRALVVEGRPYVLIGFGRWGSSDPWLGVPVDWGQISGVGVIVEATLPQMTPDLSQGSHFFHNMIGFGVFYLSVRHTDSHAIRWDWMDELPAVNESELVRHVRLPGPLSIRVDGKAGRGVIRHA